MIVNGNLKFPDNFRFGSSTAAFQVEGTSGERLTDWDEFFAQNPHIIKPDEIGPQWWIRGKAESDIKSMAQLGLKLQRISIEWGRIEPHKGEIKQDAIDRYKEIIYSIIENGMEPIVTINHFTLPQWVTRSGSWEKSETTGYYVHFAKFIVQKFPEVKYWITINEPNILIALGYLTDYFPPQSDSFLKAFSAAKNIWSAHLKAYKKIKEASPNTKVGVSFAFRWSRALNHRDKLERFYANMANEISEMSYVRGAPQKMDFIGCNYYTGYFLDLNIFKFKFKKNRGRYSQPTTILFGETRTPNSYLSDFGWPVVPGFFLDLLRKLHKTSKIPILITENGIADKKDEKRAFYILTHLTSVWRALEEGIPVEGYIHWSTIDNIEWREGYRKHFGLISLNPVNGERKLRKSALLYRDIATTGQIDVEKLISQYIPENQKRVTEKSIQNLINGKVRLIVPEGEEKYTV